VAAETSAVPLSTGRVTAAKPTSLGDRSLIRSLGLKLSRVVIDAGHGGHDTGSIGPTGLVEKDLVLDIAKRLQTLIESQMGAEVVMTRDTDTFVPLESRTQLANDEKADLFLSIHANSSPEKSVRGVETFFLNLNTQSRDALATATRENAASEKKIHELQDLLQKIVLNDKADESRELAKHVQQAMSKRGNAGSNRGVKQAPFVVLIGATMPSVLAEISFISNPDEEKRLKAPEYRQQIAESLFQGIKSYAETLSSTKAAN
jgi:N-acetylmuramoyl-L-alanine amidase